jgi:TetR/AcrR family transcriptional regulator, transcriptional repressor for nem operon
MGVAQVDTKTRILDTAQELIQRRGLNAMSFQDLSDTVGIRKASVHHHFATKNDMVASLLVRYLKNFDSAVDRVMSSRASGLNKLESYCNLFLETLQSGGHDKVCLCGMLMVEMASLDDQSVVLVLQFVRSNGRRIEAMLREGVEDGSITIRGSVPGTARLLLAALEGSLLVARCEGGPKQLAENIAQLLTFLKKQ